MEDKVILVVEDEKPLQAAITTKLESEGFQTVSARRIDQALGYLEDVPGINAIWLDHYLLGNEDGLDLVAKVKSEGSRWKDIPIFVVSNTASIDKVESYLQLGVDRYFVKAQERLGSIVSTIKATIDHG